MDQDKPQVLGIDEKAVVDFLLELYRIYKASGLYPADHPSLLAMYVKPFKEISDVLDGAGQIAIGYRRGEGFVLGETPLARRLPILNELGEELFKRRVKTVFFLRDMKLIELRHLVEVITADPREVEEKGGGERLLQEKGVRHIWFNVVDYDKLLEKQKEAEEKAPTIEAAAVEEGPESGEGIYGFLDGEGEAAVLPEPIIVPREEPVPEDLDELIRLWNEAGSYNDFERFGNAIISKVFEAAVANDRSAVLKIVNAFLSATELTKDERHGRFVSEGLDRIVSENAALDILLKGACTKGLDDAALIEAVVRLGGRAAPRVIERLAVEDDPHGRHVLNLILVRMGKGIIPQILDRIGDSRWYIVRNMVRILGEIGERQGVEEALKETISHQDHRVRKETVRALSMIRGADTPALLKEALHDSDDGVVELAAVSLGILKDEGAAQPLIEALERIGQTSAKKEIVRALGRIGSRKAVSYLIGTLKKRSWLGGGRDDELKAACAEALAEVGTREAVEALKEGAGSSREVVRAACEEGLRRIRLG